MSLPRSSSAPHPIFAPFEPQHPLRQSGRSQASLSQSNRRPLRVQTAASAAAPASRPKIPRSTTQPYTQRVEKEDPFNLGGFYSSVLGSPEQDRQWAWLRGTEEEEDKEEEEDEEQLESELNTPEMTVGRDMVVIENEDKLGVLSLDTMFSTRSGTSTAADDERMMSPYSGEDSVIDDEALYAALRARRMAQTPKSGAATVRMGELFLPKGEALDGLKGYRSLYTGLVDF